MISDVLSNAISEIEGYQKDLPKVYDDLRPEIERVKSAMTTLREALDDPSGKLLDELKKKRTFTEELDALTSGNKGSVEPSQRIRGGR